MNHLDLISAWAHVLRSPEKDILRLIRTAPYQYRHYKIPKRHGGMRDIFHPTPSLKTVQRFMVSNIFCSLPIHETVHSYRPGLNIRAHATKHLHSNFLLRLDFKDFFPSIDREWLMAYLRSEAHVGRLDIDQGAISTVARVACRFNEEDQSNALSIGAPSSPILSNAILFDLDRAIFDLCSKAECVYTRYADDIYVSTRVPDVLRHIEIDIRGFIKQFAPKLVLNEGKTINLSKKQRRTVTGVILTPSRTLSIGRELKRSIKTRIYLYSLGDLTHEEVNELSGLLAFICDVEPEFFSALSSKFGTETLDILLRRRS